MKSLYEDKESLEKAQQEINKIIDNVNILSFLLSVGCDVDNLEKAKEQLNLDIRELEFSLIEECNL